MYCLGDYIEIGIRRRQKKNRNLILNHINFLTQNFYILQPLKKP